MLTAESDALPADLGVEMIRLHRSKRATPPNSPAAGSLRLALAATVTVALAACGSGPDPQALYDQAQAAQQESQKLQESVDKLEQRIAEGGGGAGHAAAAGSGHDGPHWSYEGDTGPEHWGSLSTDFEACETGQSQTPIDLDKSKALQSDLKPVPLKYAKAAGTVKNNGHTLQFDVGDTSNRMTIAGTEYTLAQFHFHTPSEHTIGGKAAPIEFHLVHKSADGKIAVVGVLGEAGDPNPALQAVLDAAPRDVEQSAPVPGQVDLSSLIPAGHEGFRYEGSLTTPPCSEGVIWTVLDEPIHLSEAQIDDFAGRFGENARPVQDAHGRTIVFDPDLSQ